MRKEDLMLAKKRYFEIPLGIGEEEDNAVLFACSLGKEDLGFLGKGEVDASAARNRESFFRELNLHLPTAYIIPEGGTKVFETVLPGTISCDGLWTAKKYLILALPTADCFPILVRQKSPARIALLHCGWRGAMANMPVALLKEAWNIRDGSDELGNITVTFGPGICRLCYTVHSPVQIAGDEQMRLAWKDYIHHRIENLYTIDLAGYMTARLCAYGVPMANIHDPRYCTFHYPNLFPSYCRDKTLSRLLTIALLR